MQRAIGLMIGNEFNNVITVSIDNNNKHVSLIQLEHKRLTKPTNKKYTQRVFQCEKYHVKRWERLCMALEEHGE